MRLTIPALLAVLALAACRSEPETVVTPAGHEAMVASMGGNYTWNCTLQKAEGDGSGQWRFVIRNQPGRGGQPEPFLVEAGSNMAERLIVSRRDAAVIYDARDGSEILIASDGEVFAEGKKFSKGWTYPTGRCTRGNA